MKNVLLHVGSYDRLGGTNEFVRTISEYFSSKEDISKVVVLSHKLEGDDYKERDINSKTRVIYFPAFHRKKFALSYYILRFIIMAFYILKVSIKYGINNVIVGETEALPYFILKAIGVRIIMRAGTFYDITKQEFRKEKGRSFLKESIIYFYQRIILLFADRIVARSMWELRNVQKFTGKRVYLIKYAYDAKLFFPSEKSKKEKNIIYTGRIAKIKGIDILVEIFDKIRSKVKTKLVLVGWVDEHENLDKILKNAKYKKDIVFLGKKSHEEIGEILRKNYLFVHTSPDTGNSLIEAAACGLPVVTLGENFKEISYCIYNKDKDSFANAVVELLNNKKKHEHERKKVLEEINTNHGIKNFDKYSGLMKG